MSNYFRELILESRRKLLSIRQSLDCFPSIEIPGISAITLRSDTNRFSLPKNSIIFGFSYENMKVGDEYSFVWGGGDKMHVGEKPISSLVSEKNNLKHGDPSFFQSIFINDPFYYVLALYTQPELVCLNVPLSYDQRSDPSFFERFSICSKASENTKTEIILYVYQLHQPNNYFKRLGKCRFCTYSRANVFVYVGYLFAAPHYNSDDKIDQKSPLFREVVKQEKELLEFRQKKQRKRRRLFPSMFMSD